MVEEVRALKNAILEQGDAHVKLVGEFKEEKEVLIQQNAILKQLLGEQNSQNEKLKS